jgi:hypothetical protein
MKKSAILFLVIIAAACAQKRVQIASEPVRQLKPTERPAIDFLYVAVPHLLIHETPSAEAPVIGKVGIYETVPVLARNGDWSEIRLFEASGWVKSNELMDGASAAIQSNDHTPRFYVAPKQVPFNAHGEIVFNAKVNTDGDVAEITLMKNTTGSTALAKANEAALFEAKFFPLVDKGTWRAFIYEYRVAY